MNKNDKNVGLLYPKSLCRALFVKEKFEHYKALAIKESKESFHKKV